MPSAISSSVKPSSISAFARQVVFAAAVGAELAREALGHDQEHGGGDVEGRHAHVGKAGEALRRIIGVQRGQHEVTSLRGLDRDLGGFQVADLADHDDVRVLAQEGA